MIRSHNRKRSTEEASDFKLKEGHGHSTDKWEESPSQVEDG